MCVERCSAQTQTIYGELISLESNSDALGLAMFILQRLLWNPDIAAEYRHAKVPHLYKDGNLICCVDAGGDKIMYLNM